MRQNAQAFRQHSKVNLSSTGLAPPSTGHSRQGSNSSAVSAAGSSAGVSSANSTLSRRRLPLEAGGEVANSKQGVLVALHRKMVPQAVYLLSVERYKPTLFGLPVIVACAEATTCQDIYKSVWMQVSRLVSPLPPKDSVQNHATDW